jgi:glycosyltransferase involved in cell wall biosynthesis
VEALRRKGIDARLVVVERQKLHPEADWSLDRPSGFWGRQAVQWPAFLRLLPRTDVFHFYFGWTLVPRRLQWPILKATRRKSVLHFLGSDIRGKAPEELRYARGADARIVGSYDALRWVPDAHVVPPGLDLRQYTPAPSEDRLRPVVLHAPSSRRRKGTEHVIAACEGLEVELDIVEGLRHDEARRHYERADIVVDQLNAGWYGIFAVEAMALGKPVLSYLHDEAAEETEHALGVEIPIVRITKETLRERIAELAGSADERLRIGASSRSYVERVHDADRGADRLIGIYTSLF